MYRVTILIRTAVKMTAANMMSRIENIKYISCITGLKFTSDIKTIII